MAKFLCPVCMYGVVIKTEGSEVERPWCQKIGSWLTGKVVGCSGFSPLKVPKEKKGK